MNPRTGFHIWRAGALAGGLGLLLTALGVSGCQAVSTQDLSTSRQSIAGGTADASHRDVFLLAWHSDQIAGLCTATLIADNLLLTARHCVSPSNDTDHVLCGDAVLGDPYPPSAFFATNDAQPREGSPFFGAREVRVPMSGVDTCGYDIALVILKDNVPASIATPAVPRIDREATPGEAYTAVGYGLTESGDPSGGRMELAGLSVECEPGSCGDGVESTEFLGETGICSGDSGGPALDSEGRVLGVVSRGGPGCTEPIYGSVAAWRDFIVQTAKDAATLGGYDPPFWVTSGSSELPSVAIGAGGAGGAGGEGAVTEPSGHEGDGCESSGDCQAGLVCYAKTSGASGVCSATCSAASDCDGGSICKPVGSVSVCTAPTESGDDSGGCSLAAPHAPRAPRGGGVLLAAGGLALAWLRRRSHTR